MGKRRRRQRFSLEPQCADIEKLSHEGRGIATVDDKTTFITNALPGEQVEFQYTAMASRYAEGKTLKVLKTSPDRVEAKCEFFGLCGGCSLQHMAHDKQIELKQSSLLDLLEHMGKCQPKAVLPPLTGVEYGYRHKARLGVRYVIKKQTVLVGFREVQSRYLAQIDHCEVLDPRVGQLITPLRQLIANLRCFEHIAQIEVAMGDAQAALIFRNMVPLEDEDAEQLREFGQQHGLMLFMQPGKPSSIYRLFPVEGEDYLTYTHPAFGLTMWFYPTDFTQVNPAINQVMVQQALEHLQLTEHDTVLDLFCGLGNFTLPMATRVKSVVGVEGSDEMVQRGRMNSERNQLSNVEFYCADLFKPVEPFEWAKRQYTKLLIDPARNGAIEVIPHIRHWMPERIVYVSCNPSTLARDAAEILALGYILESAGIIDMFPQTNHVESMGVFVRVPKLSSPLGK